MPKSFDEAQVEHFAKFLDALDRASQQPKGPPETPFLPFGDGGCVRGPDGGE